MIFPAFIDNNKTVKQRATARLRYVLATLAVRASGRHSMRGLAQFLELDHSTLSTYVRRGGCSKPTASLILKKIPDCPVTVEQLMWPLTIGEK